MQFLKLAESIRTKVIEYRRHFHMYPELSRKEFETAEYIAVKLESFGIEVKRGVGTPLPGVTGLLRGSGDGRTVALRADIDALAVPEKRDNPYCSRKPGIMHACGHDAHAAILLGAAELLSKHREELNGNVLFIFQPSEELLPGGALPMIQAGVLENPQVDAIFGLHMDPSYSAGQLGISYGETLGSSDKLTIKIIGKSAHGANPHQGVDAIVVAAHALVALQSMMSRAKDAFSPAILSFGVIKGGEQPNVIAEEVILSGMARSLNSQMREELIAKMHTILKGITEAFGAAYEFTREKSYDSLVNDNEMVEFVRETASTIIGPDSVKQLEQPRLIVEDFSYYLQRVPGAFSFLGCGNISKGITEPLHSSRFDLDEDALQIGVAIQTAIAVNYLKRFS